MSGLKISDMVAGGRRANSFVAVVQILKISTGAVDQINLEQVFQELQDWEHQLQHSDIDFEELGL